MAYIVEEAHRSVPAQSEFYQCIKNVVAWHKEYPNDWKQTWLEVQKWANDVSRPDGVFAPLNIDAKVNPITQNTNTSTVTEFLATGLIFFDINWWAKNQKSP